MRLKKEKVHTKIKTKEKREIRDMRLGYPSFWTGGGRKWGWRAEERQEVRRTGDSCARRNKVWNLS